MNELEHFSLRWNNFHSNMSSGFCALLQEDALVDVTLAAEGRILQAHKLVLSVCSPYFKQLFAANPCKHPIVILKDVHHKQLSDLLNFMYQGEVNVRQEELATFLKTAELLQIKGLTEQEPDPSNSLTNHGHKEERHMISSQKHLSIPKSRQLPTRRIRHSEKQIPVSTLTSNVPPSPTPSPPPNKRLKSSSPALVNEDNDNQEDDRGNIGNEEPESENSGVCVKTEPSAEFDSQSCRNVITPQDSETGTDNTSANKQDTLPQKTAPFQCTPTASSNGGSQKTDSNLCNRTPQRLPSDMNATASTSSFTLTPSDSAIPANDQGQLRYVWSIRGTPQLVLDGYIYSLSEDFGYKKYWKCTEYIKAGCRGFCKTEGEKTATITKPHNHARCFDKIRAKEEIARRKLLTLRLLGTPSAK